MIRAFAWSLIITVLAIETGLLMAFNSTSPLRPLVTFCFLLICPGMAYVRLFQIKDRLTEWTLAIALSMAFDTSVSEILIFTNYWSPGIALLDLIVISGIGVAIQIATLGLPALRARRES